MLIAVILLLGPLPATHVYLLIGYSHIYPLYQS